MVRKILAATAAFGLIASPVAARPVSVNPAAKLSLQNAVPANARVAAKDGKTKLLGGGVFVAIIAAVAVITGIIIVANEDDGDSN